MYHTHSFNNNNNETPRVNILIHFTCALKSNCVEFYYLLLMMEIPLERTKKSAGVSSDAGAGVFPLSW